MVKIKRVIAKEVLIILGLGIALYFILILFQNIPVVLPRYRLVFENGETRVLSISPEIRNDYNYRKLLEEAHNPSSKFVERRLREFVKESSIRSALKSSCYINSTQVYLSRLCSRLLGTLFIVKLAIVYLVLLLVRLVAWAVRFI
jgi:hypothetical protein